MVKSLLGCNASIMHRNSSNLKLLFTRFKIIMLVKMQEIRFEGANAEQRDFNVFLSESVPNE